MDSKAQPLPEPDAGDSSPFGFYKPMSGVERRTFWSCFAGWTTDGMDYMIYPLVIGSIIKLWGIGAGTAGLAVTATLLTSSVGGWLAGFLSDRIGRVLALKITILWFSFFSLACAFTQNFDQLILARALLGLGFGGEWAVGAVLMSEIIRPKFRGRAVGVVQSGYGFGWGAAVILQTVLFSVLPEAVAWRWMFAMGAAPALLVFTLLNRVEEPPLALAARKAEAAAGGHARIWEIFKGPQLRTTILASLMLTGAHGGGYAMSTWVPRFLTTERKMSVVGSNGYLATLILGSIAGFLCGAWLADAIGRRRLFLIFSAGAVATLLLYLQVPLPDSAVWLLGFPLGFFTLGFFAGVGPFLSELYPTRLRGSGQGFCYNFGRGIGSFFPALVGVLAARWTLGDAITVCSVAGFCIFFVTAFAFPETRGKVLD